MSEMESRKIFYEDLTQGVWADIKELKPAGHCERHLNFMKCIFANWLDKRDAQRKYEWVHSEIFFAPYSK